MTPRVETRTEITLSICSRVLSFEWLGSRVARFYTGGALADTRETLKGVFMRNVLITYLFIIAITTCAVGGTIEGKAAPNSVVYVDAIPGKSSPAPSQRPTMGQQGLAFNPHILAIQQGTTVEFQNNDSVQHNIF